MLLTAASFFPGAPAVLAQDARGDDARESKAANPTDSQQKGELLSAVTNKLQAQIVNIQAAVENGSLSVADANVILTKVRKLLTIAVSMQTGDPDAGRLEDFAKQSGTLIMSVSRMIDVAADPVRTETSRETSLATAAPPVQRPAVKLPRARASVPAEMRDSLRASQEKPEPPIVPDRSAIISAIQNTLLLILQARATLDDTGSLTGDLTATAQTVNQALVETTQDILDTQGTAQDVIGDANDGMAAINDVSSALADATGSVSGITGKTGSEDAEALILDLLGTVSSDLNGIEEDTQQALSESQAVLTQTDQLLAQGETIQTNLGTVETELAAMQATITDRQARIAEIETALQGDALTQSEAISLLDEAQALMTGIQEMTAAVQILEDQMATMTATLDGMASARSTLDETAHVAAELTPDDLDTEAVAAQLNTIQNIKVGQVKALERALDADLPGDLVNLDTLADLATGKLGVGEMRAITDAIAGGLPLDLQQQTLTSLGETTLTIGGLKALAAATQDGAFEGQEAALLNSLISGELSPGGLRKLAKGDAFGNGVQVAALDSFIRNLPNIAPASGGARPSINRDLREVVSAAAKQSANAAQAVSAEAASKAARSTARQAAQDVQKLAQKIAQRAATRVVRETARNSARAAANAARKAARQAAARAAAAAAQNGNGNGNGNSGKSNKGGKKS